MRLAGLGEERFPAAGGDELREPGQDDPVSSGLRDAMVSARLLRNASTARLVGSAVRVAVDEILLQDRRASSQGRLFSISLASMPTIAALAPRMTGRVRVL